ncbi:MAG: hypothetical protein GF403_09905 [Candidatus Coatesbacteria bacterium]|nr:hypothetical protein [Candidatus Coatesbacteria bacterium]
MSTWFRTAVIVCLLGVSSTAVVGSEVLETLEYEGHLVEIIADPMDDGSYLEETRYRIGPDDMLRITVAGDVTLSGNYYVDPEGYLNLPYLDDFRAAGLTVREMRRALVEAWEPYLGRLSMGVDVLEYNSCRVYVLGEVVRPGYYQYRASISLLEALAEAGGLNVHAVDSEVAVVRLLAETTRLYLVDVEGILERGEALRDIPLAAGDIVFVPRSFIGDWNQFLADISPTLRMVIEANNLYRLTW